MRYLNLLGSKIMIVQKKPNFFNFGSYFWMFYVIACGLLSLYSQDKVLFTLCLLSLPVGASLLWREGEPPILFAMFFIHWLQITSGMIRAAFEGLSLVESYQNDGVVGSTTLSLVGLMLIALSIHVVIRNVPGNRFAYVKREIDALSVSRVFLAYILVSLFVVLAGGVFWRFGGFAQMLYAMISLKWAFYFVLAVLVLNRGEGKVALIFVSLFEVILGFSSFFSEYKTVFFVFGLAVLTSRETVSKVSVLIVTLVFTMVIIVSSFWSVIKLEYRDFLSGGTGEQVVLVDTYERYEKLSELMARIEYDDFSDGFRRLVDRVQYVAYFGHVYSYVPSSLPHAGGEITYAALRHIFTPRLLFPEKASLTPDVMITEKYTGLNIIIQQGWNTEVPVGYMADFYIDFGPYLMFLPVIALGLLYGYQYRYFLNRNDYMLFSYGCISVIMKTASDLGTSSVKILGGNITAFLAIAVIYKFVLPRIYDLLEVKSLRVGVKP